MQSRLHKGVYIGAPLVDVKPGALVEICQVSGDFPECWQAWEVRPRGAGVEDDWTEVDRLDLVIPGARIDRKELERAAYVDGARIIRETRESALTGS